MLDKNNIKASLYIIIVWVRPQPEPIAQINKVHITHTQTHTHNVISYKYMLVCDYHPCPAVAGENFTKQKVRGGKTGRQKSSKTIVLTECFLLGNVLTS